MNIWLEGGRERKLVKFECFLSNLAKKFSLPNEDKIEKKKCSIYRANENVHVHLPLSFLATLPLLFLSLDFCFCLSVVQFAADFLFLYSFLSFLLLLFRFFIFCAHLPCFMLFLFEVSIHNFLIKKCVRYFFILF